ncbi:MAG: hypothetical protein ACTSSH_06400, partial [Candidatus Heimdallarchaeota archaeon]
SKVLSKEQDAKMKRIRDDLGSTIDGEDNLAKMIMIEQAIDAACEIEEPVSKSYAYSDCILAILEFSREVNNETNLERVEALLEQVTNKGAKARTLSYLAVVQASFGHEEKAESSILEAIKTTALIKDDFDRRDALLDIATSAGDLFFLLNKRAMFDTALSFSDRLTRGQKAYLYGYLASLLTDKEGTSLMRQALEVAETIKDPITRSKVFLELASLLTNFQKKLDV